MGRVFPCHGPVIGHHEASNNPTPLNWRTTTANRGQLGGEVSASPVKGFRPATDQEERRGICPSRTRRLLMAAERYRLVTPGSLRAACPTTTAWWGGCPWRSTTKRTG